MKRKSAVILLALALAAGTVCGVVVATLGSDTIAAGVSIVGVDVGGLTRNQVRDRMSPVVRRIRAEPVTLIAGDRQWRVGLRRLGMSPDLDASVARAYAIGRQGGSIRQFIVRFFRAGAGKDLGLQIAFDLPRLDVEISRLARAVERPHRDAKLYVQNGVFIIEPERPGIKLDAGKCARDVMLAVTPHGIEPVRLSVVEDKPDVTSADLQSIDTLLATFTTRYPAFRKNRTHNIHLALKPLDGALVGAGEVFSFNNTVGPRLKELGYRDAPVFVHGELEPGTGGGVCQVSTTVYNAALLADMQILQRSHHSSPVPYVPMGRDATVAYGLLDLRFRNTASNPIYITARAKGSRLTVSIYGSGADKREVEIRQSSAFRLPHTTHTLTSKTLAPGTRVLKTEGHDGYSLKVYRIVKLDGAVIRRQLVSRDVYRPLHTKVVVGAEPQGPSQTALQ